MRVGDNRSRVDGFIQVLNTLGVDDFREGRTHWTFPLGHRSVAAATLRWGTRRFRETSTQIGFELIIPDDPTTIISMMARGWDEGEGLLPHDACTVKGALYEAANTAQLKEQVFLMCYSRTQTRRRFSRLLYLSYPGFHDYDNTLEPGNALKPFSTAEEMLQAACV